MKSNRRSTLLLAHVVRVRAFVAPHPYSTSFQEKGHEAEQAGRRIPPGLPSCSEFIVTFRLLLRPDVYQRRRLFIQRKLSIADSNDVRRKSLQEAYGSARHHAKRHQLVAVVWRSLGEGEHDSAGAGLEAREGNALLRGVGIIATRQPAAYPISSRA